jgi:hypothetical protein
MQQIKSYSSVNWGEFSYCENPGIVYQNDTSISIDYGKQYLQHYKDLFDTPMAKKINQYRVGLTERYCDRLIDIGVGSGEFLIKSKIKVLGYDINLEMINWLKSNNLFCDPYKTKPEVDGWTFWDTLEHIPNPELILSKIIPGQYIFISIPIIEDLLSVKANKHFKPNEHYYYFSSNGLIQFMKDCKFELILKDDGEVKIGRESIGTFIFVKCI